MPHNDLFGPLDDIPSLSEIRIAIYITDQSHESQRNRLPADAIPGFVVSVYRLDRVGRPLKCLDSMWNRTAGQAEQIAQEYARQYLTLHACGW